MNDKQHPWDDPNFQIAFWISYGLWNWALLVFIGWVIWRVSGGGC